ncbi:hypothetical protein NECAME_00244 [Necator americanus]|uniref:Uncharacterized protein n=1 Tax=Necator americanus TaxID=51031 RepID=W2TJC1_NECAM|nr:hypothetical protein NECAME_00244 [Necator americanus]ETN81893.1 hypothetical protein NECAME_00244 [Necator americanus]
MSFQYLRTVDGGTHEKFFKAANASGFLDDDTYYCQSIQEAAQFRSIKVTKAANEILTAMNNGDNLCLFIDGPKGTAKTSL